MGSFIFSSASFALEGTYKCTFTSVHRFLERRIVKVVVRKNTANGNEDTILEFAVFCKFFFIYKKIVISTCKSVFFSNIEDLFMPPSFDLKLLSTNLSSQCLQTVISHKKLRIQGEP